MVSCQKGPTRHAYAWQIGPFWQDTLNISWTIALMSGVLDIVLLLIWHWRNHNALVRQQAITWANVDPNLSRQMASLDHNELEACLESSRN